MPKYDNKDLMKKIAELVTGQSATLPFNGLAIQLLNLLGYASDKTVDLPDSRPDAFFDMLSEHLPPDIEPDKWKEKALFDQWQSADVLFQLTDDEISGQKSLFDETTVNASLMESYLFFAVSLTGNDYPRGKLAQINRDFLAHLHATLNAPDHPIRNQLIRLCADSPDLFAIIKQDGKV